MNAQKTEGILIDAGTLDINKPLSTEELQKIEEIAEELGEKVGGGRNTYHYGSSD